MCGRFTLFSRLNSLLQQFAIESGVDFDPRYNIAPTQEVPVVRLNQNGNRELVANRWGLIPSWAKEISIGNRMINARAESVRSKPAFRNAFRRRRCLVPADGYFEWVRSGKEKIPYLIQTRQADTEQSENNEPTPFMMAGLWEKWNGTEKRGPEIESFTVITTSANAATCDIHDRMPVILDPVDFDAWLDPGFDSLDELESLLIPYDADRMKITRVSTRVNNVRNDDPQCLEEV